MDFNINYKNFVRGLVPHFMRKLRFLDFLNSFVKPLQDINDSLVVLRDAIFFKLAFNAQVIYLEKYLNITYPNPTSGIYIQDGANVVYFYTWNYVELQADVIFFNYAEAQPPVYIFNMNELIGGLFSYTIQIPTIVQTSNDFFGNPYVENILKKRVNIYNNAGKSYNIIYF